jgi:Ca-activated chloride channel family protein
MLGNEKALWLLFVVPAILAPLYVLCFWRKAQLLKKLAGVEILKKINTSVSVPRQIFKAFMLIAAFIIIAVALTQPRWNPRSERIKRQGRDICVLLDTSRSMLAEDIRPNRLQRAKLAIQDLLEKLGGDRIAIITFAGNNAVKCPLTQDYGFVRMVLADITTESTSLGGTIIGDAIRKATDEVFDKKSREYKDIILISDGEEHKGYESFAKEAAQKASQEGIRIIAIGLGDENEGGRIPVIGQDGQKTFLKYKGQEVWSKLNGDLLREIAATNKDGRYVEAGPGKTFDLGNIYEQLIAQAGKKELESVTMTKYDEKFQIFVAAAFVLLVCEAFVSEQKKI